MINYLAELNDEQFKVVSDLTGTALVIAGAGTGKTKTLTMRAARMIDTNIKAENILTLTFTTKAAREMKSRLYQLLGDKSNGITACTYHSFCAQILREYSHLVGLKPNYVIIDNPEQAIKKIIGDRGYKKKLAKEMLSPSILYSLFSNQIVKHEDISKTIKRDYPDFTNKIFEILDINKEFKQYKIDKNIVDFTDLLYLCNKLLEDNPNVARTLAKKYQYIMVDEYQDSNDLQCNLLKLLLSDVHNNLMVVGDDMQSIYSFQGANYKNILDFPKQFKNCRINILDRNYRSNENILNLANAIIKDAPYKFEKKLYTNNKSTITPILRNVNNNYDEIDDILIQIEKFQNYFGLENIAILARNSYQFNLLEAELLRRNIPYQKYGGIKFFEKAHIKDVFSFFRVITNYSDELAWLRILPLIPNLGDASAEKIVADILIEGYDGLINPKYEKKKFYPWLKDLHNLLINITVSKSNVKSTFGNPTSFMCSLDSQMESLKNVFLSKLFEEAYPEDYEDKLRDYDLLFEIAKDYDSLTLFLEDIQLNGTPLQCNDKEHCLTLSTIHSAKGLEWHTVLIMDVIEGCMPGAKAIASKDIDMIEEERRLLYVAITRAKNQLLMYKPKTYFMFDNFSSTELCRFLKPNEVSKNYIEK